MGKARSRSNGLRDVWMDDARPRLRGVLAAFGGDHRGRLNRRIEKEVGFRHRHHGRLPLASEPRHTVGRDLVAVHRALALLVRSMDTTVVLPDSSNGEVVGRPCYAGAWSPTPFQWVQVLCAHSQEDDIVWEIGPGTVASAGWVGEQLQRHAWLMQLPDPEATGHTFRLPVPAMPGAVVGPDRTMPMVDHIDLARSDSPPALVLVVLPVLCDLASIRDVEILHQRLAREGERPFSRGDGRDLCDRHPEFAFTPEAFLASTLDRLKTLDILVQEASTKVCIASPLRGAVPKAVERAVRQHLRWSVVDRRFAFEEGGMVHALNGTSLVGVSLTVWGAA